MLGLLHHQAELILKGLTAFAAWSGTGTETDANAVRETEHEADDARGALLSALGTALVTPVEQEDLYAISERLDRVLNEVKNIVREAQELDWKPGAPAAAMGELAREGVEHLRKAVEQLGRGHTEPGAEGGRRDEDGAPDREGVPRSPRGHPAGRRRADGDHRQRAPPPLHDRRPADRPGGRPAALRRPEGEIALGGIVARGEADGPISAGKGRRSRPGHRSRRNRCPRRSRWADLRREGPAKPARSPL